MDSAKPLAQYQQLPTITSGSRGGEPLGITCQPITVKTYRPAGGFGASQLPVVLISVGGQKGSFTRVLEEAIVKASPILIITGAGGMFGAVIKERGVGTALGAGSMVASHANGAYFWAVTKISNIGMQDALRVFTSSTGVMGLVSVGCI